MDINTSGASRRLGLNAECWMFALLPEAAKMMAAKNECEHDQYVRRRITARPGDESSCSKHFIRSAIRSGVAPRDDADLPRPEGFRDWRSGGDLGDTDPPA
jgi:hypothetical protein